MAVRQIQSCVVCCVFQDQSGMKMNIGKERFFTLAGGAGKRGVFFPGKRTIFPHHVVIPVDHVEPIFLIKEGEEPECVVMDFFNLFHMAVFPEFIPIS